MTIQLAPFAFTVSEFRNLQSRVLLRRFRWVWLMLCTAGIFVFSMSQEPAWRMFAVFCIVYIPLFVPLWHLWKIRGQATRHLTLEQSVTCDDDSVHVRASDGTESRLEWANVNRVEPFGAYLLLFIGPLAYFPLPTRAFRSPADWEALQEFLRGKGLV